MRNAEKSISKSSGGLKGFATGVAKVAAGIGVFKLIDKGFSMITQSVGRAISRVDALNQFPKVLVQMGYGADEAAKATQTLLDGIDGLPTTLDGITGDVQRLVNVFQDVDLAAESAIGLNNAFLASGASQDQASRGLDQYIKMLSTGKVNMQSWQTLQETMPYALQQTAEAFEFTGKTAQNDFYEALKDGDITMDQFNSKIIELSETQGGFAEVAIEATKGIGTSWANIQTAIANGVAKVITAFDNWFQSKGLGGIAGVLDIIKSKVSDAFGVVTTILPIALDWFSKLFTAISESTAFDTLKNVIQGAIDAVIGLWAKFEETGALDAAKEILISVGEAILAIDFEKVVEGIAQFLDTWSPLIAGITAGIIAFQLITGAIALWTTVTTIATAVGGAFGVVLAFITSPIGLVVIAIGLLVAAGVLLWKNWDKVTKFLGQSWDWIKNTATNIFNGLMNFFKKWGTTILAVITGPIGILVLLISRNFESIKSTAVNIFNGVKDAMTKPIEKAKETISNIIDKVKGFFSGMKLTFPKLNMPKLPSFKLEGKFNLLPPSVPKLKINWNKDGGIFDTPTIFNTNKGLQGVGEAGKEAIIPLTSSVLGGIGKGIAQTMQGGAGSQEQQINIQPSPIYLDGQHITDVTFDIIDSRFTGQSETQAYMRGDRR